MNIDFIPKHENLKIIQDYNKFCINTDTELLGEFIKLKKNAEVLDIGTNTGALLLYASIQNPKRLVGIDINKEALNICSENMKLNNIKAELINIDLREYKAEKEFNTIIFNPPYFKTKDINLSNNEYKNLAKHEGLATLEDFAKCINRNLCSKGTLYFLFLSSRLDEVMEVFKKYHLIIKELQFYYDDNSEYSNVVLIKAIKSGNPGLKILKPIIKRR